MTEAEWLACGDPQKMLPPFPSRASVRTCRLLAAACCRRIATFLPSGTQSVRDELLGTLERRADEPLPDNWSDAIWGDYEHAREYDGVEGCGELVDSYMMITNTGLLGGLMTAKYAVQDNDAECESIQQAALVRCIFGNPFRPVAIDPAWLTSTVVALARGIYDDRAFDRMPILADALQDAGCDSDDVLNHCRDDGPHARGCWVVDMVLGKA
jgi:hypothetical protein